jgi:hypothetical protein
VLTSPSVRFDVATNGGESYHSRARHPAPADGGPSSMSPAEEEEEEEEGEAAESGAVVPAAASLGVMLPSFGLTPPEEEGLKTTDGILKVGCAWAALQV